MLERLFDPSQEFYAYTVAHWVPVIVLSIFMVGMIFLARSFRSKSTKVCTSVILACIPAIAVLARVLFTVMDGTFTIEAELPLHLCRAAALIFPFVYYFRSKKWFGILYFFSSVGALQAILTPELYSSYPHHSYWTYWVLHVILFYLPIYGIFVFGYRIGKVDFINAILVGNGYLILTGGINLLLRSNYFFTRYKPATASLLDYLGPWPWYILIVELLAIFLFFLAWLPFLIRGPRI